MYALMGLPTIKVQRQSLTPSVASHSFKLLLSSCCVPTMQDVNVNRMASPSS